MFSGGSPAPKRFQTVSEAGLMERDFLSRRFPSGCRPNGLILKEDRSWHSYENTAYSLPILEHELGLDVIDKIVIVTHETHYRRFEITFPAYGFNRICLIPVEYDLSPEELRLEDFFLKLHRRNPTGSVVGRAFSLIVLTQKILGGGR